MAFDIRFWGKVDRRGPNECWEWTAAKDSNGYGCFYDRKRVVMAHRFSYELANGPILAGLEIDHLCRNHSCENPEHMEAVTHRDNVLRGEAISAQCAKKTHCPKGHPYDLFNTSFYKTASIGGGRHCRVCDREAHWRRNHRGEALCPSIP